MPKGSNKCVWQYLKSHNTCDESCINEFCSMHRSRIRGGSIIPMRCRKCGVGVQTESRLCAECGSNTIHHRLVYRGTQARRNFNKVMKDLLQNVKVN